MVVQYHTLSSAIKYFNRFKTFFRVLILKFRKERKWKTIENCLYSKLAITTALGSYSQFPLSGGGDVNVFILLKNDLSF